MRWNTAIVMSAIFATVTPARAQDGLTWPSRLGPVEVVTDDGAHRLELTGGWQAMGSVAGSRIGDSDPSVDARVLLRRARFGLRGAMFDGALTGAVQINVTPGAYELIDAWLDYRFDPQIALRVGQLTTPFTRYRQQSFRAASLVDWPLVTRFFGAERQIGLMAHNTGTVTNEWHYGVGVFSGENARASHGIGGSLAYGEPVSSPSALGSARLPESVHPEIFARVAHQHPRVGPQTGSDLEGGPPRHHVGVSLAWDLRPERARDLGVRFAIEGLLKVHHLSVNGIGYAALLPMEDGSLAPALFGALLEVSYRFDRHFEVAARYARVARTSALRSDAMRWAADMMEGAPDEATRAALAARYAAVGDTGADQELAVGLNAYVIGESLKVQLDLTWLRRERYAGPRDDLVGRLIVQLAF